MTRAPAASSDLPIDGMCGGPPSLGRGHSAWHGGCRAHIPVSPHYDGNRFPKPPFWGRYWETSTFNTGKMENRGCISMCVLCPSNRQLLGRRLSEAFASGHGPYTRPANHVIRNVVMGRECPKRVSCMTSWAWLGLWQWTKMPAVIY